MALDLDPRHVEGVIRRLKLHFNVELDGELLVKLGFKATAGQCSHWRKRGTLPMTEIVEVALRDRLSLDWVIFGEESRLLKKPAVFA